MLRLKLYTAKINFILVVVVVVVVVAQLKLSSAGILRLNNKSF